MSARREFQDTEDEEANGGDLLCQFTYGDDHGTEREVRARKMKPVPHCPQVGGPRRLQTGQDSGF